MGYICLKLFLNSLALLAIFFQLSCTVCTFIDSICSLKSEYDQDIENTR